MLRGFAFTHRITGMSLAAIIETRKAAIRGLVSRHRAANPRLFGSVLRGNDALGSDIDILVDALPGATLFDLGGLQQDLQGLCCITGRGDSLCESGSIGGRDAEACCPSIPHDELERI